MTRQTHVGIETRITIEEAEALEANLPMFASMIRNRVAYARKQKIEEHLLSGLEKLIAEISHRHEPFEMEASR